jgi:uncharacterized phage protein gp47/JayE
LPIFKTDADSVFGQLARIWSEAVADVNESIEGIVAAYNPQAAEGAFLSALVLLNGIDRNEAEYSTVTVQCTANAAGCTIPAGSLVSDPAVGEQFETDSQLILGASASGNVSATAVNAGPISAAAGTLTQIDTPIYGWESVTNPAGAVEGADEETDTELRVRREAAAERTGLNNVAAIYTAVADIDAVDQVTVYQNTGVATDANGVPPQHVWVVVLGGADQDIAAAMFGTVAAGIGMHGDTPVVYADPISGDNYTITFERPDDLAIYIDVEVTKDADYPVDGDDQIEDAIIAHFEDQTIGEDVEYSRLYTPINSIPGHYVTSLKIGTSPSPSGTTNVAVDPDEIAVTDAAKITVTST